MNPSGTDMRRMLAKAKEAFADGNYDFDLTPEYRSARKAYAAGVEAALAWILGERKDPPIA